MNTQDSPKFDLVARAKEAPTLKASIEYQDEMVLNLIHLPRPSLQRIYNESTVRRMDKQTHIREPKLNDKTFAQKLVAVAVEGWEGFTPRKISMLVPISLEGMTETEKDEQVPYNPEWLVYILLNAYHFDQWFQRSIQDVELFQPEQKYEEGN